MLSLGHKRFRAQAGQKPEAQVSNPEYHLMSSRPDRDSPQRRRGIPFPWELGPGQRGRATVQSMLGIRPHPKSNAWDLGITGSPTDTHELGTGSLPLPMMSSKHASPAVRFLPVGPDGVQHGT